MSADRRRWSVLSASMASSSGDRDTINARNGQLVGEFGQFECRPWSIPLAKLVNCYGEGGQVAGVSHLSPAEAVNVVMAVFSGCG
jgi:hypothetical protein